MEAIFLADAESKYDDPQDVKDNEDEDR